MSKRYITPYLGNLLKLRITKSKKKKRLTEMSSTFRSYTHTCIAGRYCSRSTTTHLPSYLQRLFSLSLPALPPLSIVCSIYSFITITRSIQALTVDRSNEVLKTKSKNILYLEHSLPSFIYLGLVYLRLFFPFIHARMLQLQYDEMSRWLYFIVITSLLTKERKYIHIHT